MFLFGIICLFTPVYKQKILQEKKSNEEDTAWHWGWKKQITEDWRAVLK